MQQQIPRPYAAALTSLIVLAGFGVFQSVVSGAARTEQQIVADMQASPIPNYKFPDQIDPRFREQMARELTGPLQRNVDLYAELAKASPKYLETARETICLDQAELAVLGNDTALKALTDESQSPVAVDALSGTLGLMVKDWWNGADAEKQKQELVKFEQLAKENPNDALICGVLLSIAKNGAVSMEIGNGARDIVEADLTSPQANTYKARPNKLGRPFVIRSQSIDHKPISTADWKGKVIIIDFWATWCPPCRAALPDLIALYQDKHDQGLEVLGVSNDYALSDLTTWLAQNKAMAWPQLYSPAGPEQWNKLSIAMNVTGIPTEFYIDRNGVLRDIEVNNLRKDLVDQLLAEPVKPDALAAQTVQTGTDQSPPEAAKPTAPAAVQADAPTNFPATPKAPVIPSDEDLAKPMLSQAKLLIANNATDLATKKLNSLIDQYPKTAAADQARALLKTLSSGQ